VPRGKIESSQPSQKGCRRFWYNLIHNLNGGFFGDCLTLNLITRMLIFKNALDYRRDRVVYDPQVKGVEGENYVGISERKQLS